MHVLVKKNSQRTQRVINMIPSQTLGFHDSMFFMCKGLGLGLWCLTPLSKYFCYIVAETSVLLENQRPVLSH